ncbi:MAG: hypothetical protein AAF620_15335, partial [Bacteroidota bacterium]
MFFELKMVQDYDKYIYDTHLFSENLGGRVRISEIWGTMLFYYYSAAYIKYYFKNEFYYHYY